MVAMNDWIVAGINNPDFTVEDFETAGLNVNNTSILSKDEYKNSPFIQKAFDKDGTFDEKSFDEYYAKRVGEFGYFSQNDKFQYDLFDTDRKPTSRVRNPQFVMYQIANPDRVTYGTGARNEFGERDKSRMELAETQTIYDPETDTFSEDTVNDRALVSSVKKWINSIIEDPLVMAQYEEDGVHEDPFTGQIVEHKKGDYKLNKNGTYYTEKINGRNPADKLILSFLDTLTIDGEGINKYDFFDADDIDKSVHGVVYKNAINFIPLLWGPTALILGGLFVTREIAKSLPMLYGIVNSFLGDGSDSEVINSIAAYGHKFTGSTSEYGLEHMVSFENAANLITDVVVLWGQQQFIAKGISKLIPLTRAVEEANKKAFLLYNVLKQSMEAAGTLNKVLLEQYLGTAEKWFESPVGKAAIKQFVPLALKVALRANRIGADASLMYMSIISNTDVYDSMLLHGATKKEAAVFSLASMIGMFGVDRWTGLGEIFLHGLGDDVERSIRATVRKDVSTIYKEVIDDIAKSPAHNLNKLQKFFKTGLEFGKRAANLYADDLKYHTASFLGKAFGEGLEEVGEELVTDFVKSAYEGLGELGLVSQKDVGAWDNAMERYLMNFAGGFIGGAIFGGTDIIRNGKFNRDTTNDQMIYLIANGYKDRVLSELDKQWKSGKLGSTVLGMNYETDDNGNKVYLTKKSGEKSQNDFVYDRIKETIYLLDNILNENQVNLSDDDLFMLMILSNRRYSLLKLELDTNAIGYLTGYLTKFKKLQRDLVDIEDSLLRASKTKDGVDPGVLTEENTITDELFRHLSKEDADRRESNLNLLRQKKQELLLERDKFLNGEYSLPYTEKMQFAIDSNLNLSFLSMNYEHWLYTEKGTTIDKLSDAEAETYKQEYLAYKRNTNPYKLDIAFDEYKRIQKMANSILQQFSENEELFKKSAEDLSKIFGQDSPLASVKLYKFDDILDFNNETEESDSYINRRNSQQDVDERSEIINLKNLEILNNLKTQILEIIDNAGGNIDPVTRRRLLLFLRSRNKDIVAELRLKLNPEIAKIVENLKDDFSNIDDIKQLAKNYIISKEIENSDSYVTVINDLVDYLDFGIDDESKIKTAAEKLKVAFKNKTGKDLSNEDIAKLLFTTRSTPATTVSSNKFTEDSIKLDDDGNWYITENPLIEGFSQNDYGNKEYDELEALLALMEQAYLTDDYSLLLFEPVSDAGEFVQSLPEVLQQIENSEQEIELYVDDIKTNPLINLNNELHQKVKNINPIKNLIKGLAIKLEKNSTSLDSLLDKLSQLFEDVDSISEFTLTDDELAILSEAEDLIKKVKAYLYATAVKSGSTSSDGTVFEVGHNFALNEFALLHSNIYKDFKPLPTLSLNTYHALDYELNNYLMEIGLFDPDTEKYTFGSWRRLHSDNLIDKSELFIKAEESLNNTLLSFLKTIRDSVKIVIDKKLYDLLEGYESCGEDLNKIQHLLYSNYLKLVLQGIDIKTILSKTDLLERITKIERIPLQLTSNLDQNLHNFTDYDKMIVFGLLISSDIDEWNKFIKTRVNLESDIAPLSILEWNSRIACAQMEHPEIFEALLQKVKESNKDFDMPIIYGTFINGVAGAGKSRVIAKNAVEKLPKDSTVWLSAPTNRQVKTLSESVRKGLGMTIKGDDSLFSKICDLSALNQMESDERELKSDSKYFTLGTADDNTYCKVNFSELGIKKLDDAPSIIIVDEATHISNTALLILSEFCKINGTKLVLIGHSKQNGNGTNIRREVCYTVRTPELAVSLRDNNELHQSNLRKTESMLSELSDKDSTESQRILPIIKSKLRNLNLRVFMNLEEVNGDLITSSIDNVPFKITPDESGNKVVGYVGNNVDTISKLQAKGLTVEVLKEIDVLGQEFLYVVIEKDWNLPSSASVLDTYLFLSDLYTMMSRGQTATIFLSNTLQTIIGKNTIDTVKAQAPSFKPAIENFIKRRLSQLENTLTTTVEKPKNNITNNITELNKESKISINNSDGLYSFIWLNKYKEFPIGIEVVHSGDEVLFNIGYIDNGVLKSLPEDASLWSFLGIENLKPTTIKYNAITKEITAVSGTDSKKLNENPYPDLLDILTLTPEGIVPEGSVMFEPPTESPTFKEPINPLDVGDNEEDSTSFDDKVLCWGSTALTGYEVKEENGLEVWVRPTSSDVLKDIQILTTLERIDSTEEQIQLSNRLRSLRNLWLFDKDYSDLSTSQLDIISKDEFENAKYFVEVRELSNDDNFIRNLGLSRDAMHIGKYVYTVVVEFNNKFGQKCRLTLGMLGSPDTFDKQVPNIKSKLNKKLGKLLVRKDKGEDVNDKILEISQKIANVSKLALDYRLFMSDLESKGVLKIEINKPDFTGMTHLRKNHNGKPIKPSRLYSYTKAQIKLLKEELEDLRPITRKLAEKEIEILEQQIDKSFLALNPYTVVSDVYVYSPDNLGKLSGVEEKVAGSAVVFVSNDDSLTPEELVDIYIQLKNAVVLGEESLPRVRMLVLNNRGVQFSELISPWHKGLMQISNTFKTKSGETKTIKNITPFMNDFMGARMFVSMWNFRANLLEFCNKIRNLAEDKTLLEKYAIVSDLVYKRDILNESLTKKELELVLAENDSEYEHYKQVIDRVNRELNGSVKQFRLGGGYKKGHYIRRIVNDKSLSALYGDTIPYGIYITPSKAFRYLEIIESIFRNSLDHVIKIDGIEKNKLITTEDGAINSLRNHYKEVVNEGKVKIKDGETIVEFNPASSTLSTKSALLNIPAILMKTIKFVNGLRAYPEDFDPGSIEITHDSNKIEIPYENIYDELFKTDLGYDSTLEDLMALCFHGTTEDISKQGVLKCSDAFFPNGLYVDPMCSQEVVLNNEGVAFKKCIINPIFFDVDVMVDDPTFYIDFKPKKQLKNEQPIIVKENPYVEIGVLLGINIEPNADPDDVLDEINDSISSNLKILFKNSDVINGKKPFFFKDNKLYTFTEYFVKQFEEKEGKSFGTILNISLSDGKIIIESENYSVEVTPGGMNELYTYKLSGVNIENTYNEVIDLLKKLPVKKIKAKLVQKRALETINKIVDELNTNGLTSTVKKLLSNLSSNNGIKEVMITELDNIYKTLNIPNCS